MLVIMITQRSRSGLLRKLIQQLVLNRGPGGVDPLQNYIRICIHHTDGSVVKSSIAENG